MARVICPSCEEGVKLSDRLKIGQKVTCPYCAEKLLVIQLNPVEFEWSDGEDWEDDAVDRREIKTGSRRIYDPRDPHWYEDTAWDADDAGWKMKTKRTRKKKIPGQRDARRRRYSRDKSYQGF